MRWAARTDGNHAAVVEALREEGAFVLSLAAVGRGVPDLLVVIGGETMLVEVKNGEKGKLTPDQRRWFMSYPGRIEVVRSVEDARALVCRKNGS